MAEAQYEHGHPMSKEGGLTESLPNQHVLLRLSQEAEAGMKLTMREHLEAIRDIVAALRRQDNEPAARTVHEELGGDRVPGEQFLMVATGQGKKAARHIDAYVRRITYVKRDGHGPATFSRLNTWYYTDAEAAKQPLLTLVRRQSSFDEIVGGFDADTALLEARRCLSCGNCFNCDNCYAVCPDNAVVKLESGKRYAINYDYCKGCGLCAEE